MHDLFSELYFQLITRVKAQEKKVDHLEHAKRKKEIPLIVENMKQVLNLI